MDFDVNFIWRNLPLFMLGLRLTVALSVLAIVCSLLWGMVVVWARLSRLAVCRVGATLFIEVMRNTPVLVQIYVVFFGSAILGYPLSGFVAGLLALTAQNGGYIAEIYRAGLRSVGRRQAEAGKALGMHGFELFRTVIAPQAVRRILPPLTNQGIVIIKDTALVSAFSVAELTFQARVLTDRTAAATEAFFTLAAFYLLLTGAFAGVMRAVELRTRIEG